MRQSFTRHIQMNGRDYDERKSSDGENLKQGSTGGMKRRCEESTNGSQWDCCESTKKKLINQLYDLDLMGFSLMNLKHHQVSYPITKHWNIISIIT